MAGGPCAKIFMTVKCSLLSRQLMAPDDVPMFYLFFIYLFIYLPPPALSFVSTRKETTLSLTQPNCGHSRQAYLSERIEPSSPSFLFLSSFPSFSTIHAFDLLEARSSVAGQRCKSQSISRVYNPGKIIYTGRRVALELCTLQIVLESSHVVP